MNSAIAILVLIFLVAVPSGFVMYKTEQEAKRGCGRGCATCKNFSVCHGEKQLGYDPDPAATQKLGE